MVTFVLGRMVIHSYSPLIWSISLVVGPNIEVEVCICLHVCFD